MNQEDRHLINTHTIVPHRRFGNEQAYSVTGGKLKRGQIVTVHAMSGSLTVIKKAIAQDAAEQASSKYWTPATPRHPGTL